MISIFACKHPANRLGVEREATVERADADFDRVTYHLWCCRCRKPVKITHAMLRGGVDAFMNRAKR